MKYIGKYKWPWAGCANGYGSVEYTSSPYYDIRSEDGRLQILVNHFGEKVWINVKETDLRREKC